MIAQVIIRVAESDIDDRSVKEIRERGARGARDVADGVGDLDVVVVLAVGGSDRGHGADVPDPLLLRVPVEAAQDEDAALSQACETEFWHVRFRSPTADREWSPPTP